MKSRSKGYARLMAAQPTGAHAEIVTVEADLSRGLHSFSIVGLAGKAVEEARDRISSAIRHAGYPPPKATNKKIILSLSPASLRKEGSHYDVPFAISYLIAADIVPSTKVPSLFAGELGLDGSVRPVQGLLAQLLAATSVGITQAFIPASNSDEASLLADDMDIFPSKTLEEIISHLTGTLAIRPLLRKHREAAPIIRTDISAIQGQETAKRALEIAAAGRHNIVLYGPPGTGKTMLAQALPGLLPPLSSSEILQATAIHSIAGELRNGGSLYWPPFRAPHHTISSSSLIGGGNRPRAGEVTLAHTGVLFLDELPQFNATALQALREPMENREVTITRSQYSVTFPAHCMVIAAMNPPDGNIGDATYVREYQKQARKLSRPLIDRFDMWVEVPHIPTISLLNAERSESSESVRIRVTEARTVSETRIGTMDTSNVSLSHTETERIGSVTPEAEGTLQRFIEKLQLSPRSYYRTLRVARTIADLDHSTSVTEGHVLEALQYRPKKILDGI